MSRRRVPLIELLKASYPERPEKELFALVLRGDVSVDGVQATKPGASVPADARVTTRGLSPFVSRGGEKLAHALDTWGIACQGTVWLDGGCSTGGFTDCLLKRGASLVYAVDVGVNQIDWRLRTDPRVRVMEGMNVMDIRPGSLEPAPQRVAADLSFRSLRGAAAHLIALSREKWGIFLIKPQFEWKAPSEDFRGVVRDAGTVLEIVRDLVRELSAEGVAVEKAALSPLPGRKGNRELLFLLRSSAGGQQAALEPGVLESLILERGS